MIKEAQGEGRVTLTGISAGAMLAAEAGSAQSFAEEINCICQPPVPVTDEEIYVRKMRLVGDGPLYVVMWKSVSDDKIILVKCRLQFRTESLPVILKLIQGKPLLAQHFRDLPLGRWFGGDVVEHEGVNYAAPCFWWPKGTPEAEKLRINLDGGIYKEASVGVYFAKWTCSICGKDLRQCEHEPEMVYNKQVCFAYADDIRDVFEGSLVDRGAHPGTGMEPDVRLQEITTGEGNVEIQELRDLATALGATTEEGQPEPVFENVLALAKTHNELKAALEQENLTLKARVGELEPKAALGDEYLATRRATVLATAVKAANFQKRTLTEAEQASIKAAGLEALKGLEATHEAALKAAEPPFRCPKCATELRDLRVTEPSGASAPRETAPIAANYRTR